MPRSVLEAIKMGFWDFEPPEVDCNEFDAADAMPGTKEKLRIMARRVEHGLPLWHSDDRNDVEDPPPVGKPR
ncbi:MAG TPA: hypothetical protein VMY42_10380 [Thermoguttaceae bacterium]|nr:hypothetical protein [Thermoguttaceae bacterium]